jgi:hypothetical protein
MAKKDDINFDRLDDLSDLGPKKKKPAKTSKSKKSNRKPLTHMFSYDTIKLLKRMKYWDRYNSDSEVIEKAIQALANGKSYEPTPDEDPNENED